MPVSPPRRPSDWPPWGTAASKGPSPRVRYPHDAALCRQPQVLLLGPRTVIPQETCGGLQGDRSPPHHHVKGKDRALFVPTHPLIWAHPFLEEVPGTSVDPYFLSLDWTGGRAIESRQRCSSAVKKQLHDKKQYVT